MKRFICVLCLFLSVVLVFPQPALAAKRKKKDSAPAFQKTVKEHHYQLQSDSYEATDTQGGYRHYICADCGDEYDYTTDPMVYTVNPKTGAPVDQQGALNPLLPSTEHIPDPEPQVFWSRADNEWRLYLYGSHDAQEKSYCGFDYLLYSAPVYDLSDWRFEGKYLDISEGATSGATVGLFAPDCAYDVTTDQYYLISNEFNAYAVLRTADSPVGPWEEKEAEWYISVKACYDPSILIENGTIYIAGSCMPPAYREHPEVADLVEEAGYHTGMSHIAVIYQLKEDLSDGDGIAAISWMPNDELDFLPIYEGPSLQGYVEELGVYVYFCVEADVAPDGTMLNNPIGWLWTDDLMNGTWHYGENGVPEVYADQAELISGNRGNTVSDTSGRYALDPLTGEMTFSDFTTYPHGNNHGGMARVNGHWYFFGHRQTNNHSYSRQAIAGEVRLFLEGQTPVITPFEFTSSGVAGSMDAYAECRADRACYLIAGADQKAPSMDRSNAGSAQTGLTPYIVMSRDETAVHNTYITDLCSGSVVGYKYLDFGGEEVSVSASLLLNADTMTADAEAEVWLDAPSAEKGGTLLGTICLTKAEIESSSPGSPGTNGMVWHWISGDMAAPISGVHGVYFRFLSADTENALCAMDAFRFLVK